MGGTPFHHRVYDYLLQHPNQLVTADAIQRALGLKLEQVQMACNRMSKPDRYPGYDVPEGILEVVRRAHTWRLLVDMPGDANNVERGSRVERKPPSADPAELINSNGSPTFTWVGYTKQGPAVRDQDGKLFVLKEM